MAFLASAFRVIVVLLLIRFVLRLISSGRRPVAPPKPRPVPERTGGTLVRDPHCGTYIPESRAITVGRGATAMYFCSAACRDAWQRSGFKADGAGVRARGPVS